MYIIRTVDRCYSLFLLSLSDVSALQSATAGLKFSCAQMHPLIMGANFTRLSLIDETTTAWTSVYVSRDILESLRAVRPLVNLLTTRARPLPRLQNMPKAPSALPASALFGVAKPSGPTSMSVLDTLKPLLASSRLFVEEKELNKEKGKTRRGRHAKYAVKIGQGGTLDPLADGVLGIWVLSSQFVL